MLPFEVGEKGMRCFSVRMRFLVPMWFFFQRKQLLPCGGKPVVVTSSPLVLPCLCRWLEVCFLLKHQSRIRMNFLYGKNKPKKTLQRGARRIREIGQVNMYLFPVTRAARPCLFLELPGRCRLFCSVVVIAVPVSSILRLPNERQLSVRLSVRRAPTRKGLRAGASFA